MKVYILLYISVNFNKICGSFNFNSVAEDHLFIFNYEHAYDIITHLTCRLHMYSQVWLTDAGRFTPRPHSVSFTHASTVSHQVVTSITTVGCYLSKCCSIGMTNLAIGSGIQSSTLYNCSMKESIYIFL